MSVNSDEVVSLLVGAIAGAFRVGLGDVAADADLLDPAGFAIRNRVLDSLELVELVTAVEDALGIDLEALMDGREHLTLRNIADFVAGGRSGGSALGRGSAGGSATDAGTTGSGDSMGS